MRKPTWWDLGIAVLGLFLVCSAAQAQYPGTGSTVQEPAQGSDVSGTGGSGQMTGSQQQTADTGQTNGTQQMSNVDLQQRQEIARLRAEVARLQLELTRMRSQPQAQAGSTGAGVGGGGSAGAGNPNAEAPSGATGVGNPQSEGVGGGGRTGGAQAAGQDTSNQGIAEVSVIHTGRVRSVSQQQLVLVDESGAASTLPLAPNVRVLRDRRQVSLQSLQEGTVVRTSASLYARGNPVTEIEVVSTNTGSRASQR